MADEKTFELMTQLYAEMKKGFSEIRSEMQSGFTDVDGRFDGLEGEVQTLKKSVLHIENDHGEKIGLLLDGYKQLAESQEEMKADIKEIKARQDTQEVEIRVIKGGKNKKSK